MKIKRMIVGMFLTNCYLLISDKEPRSRPRRESTSLRGRETSLRDEAAIIDPGGGSKEILKEVQDNNLNLKYIILTHSHPDHIFSTFKIKQKTKAQVFIHEAEKDFIKFKVDKFLREGDRIKIGKTLLKVLHTPGHSKGSICLLGDKYIFTGDTIFKDGYGRTDLPGGSPGDLKSSLQRLSKFFKKGIIIYPGHGEIFKIK